MRGEFALAHQWIGQLASTQEAGLLACLELELLLEEKDLVGANALLPDCQTSSNEALVVEAGTRLKQYGGQLPQGSVADALGLEKFGQANQAVTLYNAGQFSACMLQADVALRAVDPENRSVVTELGHFCAVAAEDPVHAQAWMQLAGGPNRLEEGRAMPHAAMLQRLEKLEDALVLVNQLPPDKDVRTLQVQLLSALDRGDEALTQARTVPVRGPTLSEDSLVGHRKQLAYMNKTTEPTCC